MMQTPKARVNSSSEATLKVSPRPARQLKAALDTGSPNSSNQKSRTSKERGVAVAERRSPRSSAEFKVPTKSPSKVSQLESQLAELRLDLGKVKEELSSSEKLKQQALQDVEESQKQILSLSAELEDSKKKFHESFSSEEDRSIEFQKISEKREQEWQAKYEALQIHHSADFAALGSAMDEIQRLKSQLEIASQTVPIETKTSTEVAVTDTLVCEDQLVEDMKRQLKECKDSEGNAHALVNETLIQLETARTAVEALQSEGVKSSEAFNALAVELKETKGYVKTLEELVCKLKAELSNNSSDENRSVELEKLKEQLRCMKSEVEFLRSAQETGEIEEQIRNTVQLNGVSEQMELMKFESVRKETDMEINLELLKSQAAELKANLMDKETELQIVIEQNKTLNRKIHDASSSQREAQYENELTELKEIVMELKANLMDKETEFQNILEENETLKIKLTKKETDIGKANDSSATELDAAKTAEREATMKLESLKEEADISSKKATRAAEQLVAAQAANAEMESELRKIKVQSDQWRKAAEVAASMLSDASPGNLMEQNGGNFSPLVNKTDSHYSEELDEDSLKKRNGNGNGNVLKKFGLSWKKNQK